MITEQSFTKRIKLLVPKVSDHLVTMLWKTRPFWKPISDEHITTLAAYLNTLGDLPEREPSTGTPLWYASAEEFFALCDEIGINPNNEARYTLYRATLPKHGEWGPADLKERLSLYADLCRAVTAAADTIGCDLVLCVSTPDPLIALAPPTPEEVTH